MTDQLWLARDDEGYWLFQAKPTMNHDEWILYLDGMYSDPLMIEHPPFELKVGECRIVKVVEDGNVRVP